MKMPDDLEGIANICYEPGTRKRLKVLLLDDDEKIRKFYTTKFTQAGIDIDTVGTTSKFQKKIFPEEGGINNYDVILVDIFLNGRKEGDEAIRTYLERIKDRGCEPVKFIRISAEPLEETPKDIAHVVIGSWFKDTTEDISVVTRDYLRKDKQRSLAKQKLLKTYPDKRQLTRYIDGYITKILQIYKQNKNADRKVVQFKPLSLLSIEVPEIDRLRVEEGWQAKKDLIEDLASFYISNVKPTDIRGRYEENRFLILLPDTDFDLAHEKVYERLKNGYLRSGNLKQGELKKSHNSIATIDKSMFDAIIQREQIDINSTDAVTMIRNKVFDILNGAHQNHKVMWSKADSMHYLNNKNAITAHYLNK